MKHQKKQFAICIRNEGAEDIEIRKVYQILPATRAVKDSRSEPEKRKRAGSRP